MEQRQDRAAHFTGTRFNGISDTDSALIFDYVTKNINRYSIAYLPEAMEIKRPVKDKNAVACPSNALDAGSSEPN